VVEGVRPGGRPKRTWKEVHVVKGDIKIFKLSSPHMWSRNKINSVLATIYFISAPSGPTCADSIK